MLEKDAGQKLVKAVRKADGFSIKIERYCDRKGRYIKGLRLKPDFMEEE